MLRQAAHARRSGESAEAERLCWATGHTLTARAGDVAGLQPFCVPQLTYLGLRPRLSCGRACVPGRADLGIWTSRLLKRACGPQVETSGMCHEERLSGADLCRAGVRHRTQRPECNGTTRNDIRPHQRYYENVKQRLWSTGKNKRQRRADITAWAEGPGTGPLMQSRAEGPAHTSASIPNIFLVEGDAVPGQKRAHLVLKTFVGMVRLLVVDVPDQGVEVLRPARQRTTHTLAAIRMR